MRPVRPIMLAGGLLLVAACGSTVPLSDSTGNASGGLGAGSGGLGPVAGATSGPVTGAGPAGAGPATGSVGAVTASSGSGSAFSAGPTGGTGGSGVAAPASTAGAPGVTATSIAIGASYVADAAAADSAEGAAGINPGDTQSEADVLISYLNAHGGIAHRRIVPVWFEGTATANVQSEYQQACAKWTQDTKVFAFGLGDLAGGNPVLDECAAKASVLDMTTGGVALEDGPILQHYPSDIDLTELTDDDAMRVTIQGLARQGYFSRLAKVGVATWDQADFAYGVTHVALPALAALGYSHVPVAYVAPPQSEGDLGSTSASINSAVLKFHTAGVDHVLLFDGEAGINGAGTLVLLWMNDAQSQQYNPRYGLNSTSGLSTLAPDLPAAQMTGSLAVGWVPLLDEASSDYPRADYPAPAQTCLQIMTAGGQAPSNNNQAANEVGICDWFFFLKRVLDPLGGDVTTSRALAAIDAVGRGYTPGITFGLDVTPSRHDGVAEVRNAAFVGSCSCYRYTSGPYQVG